MRLIGRQAEIQQIEVLLAECLRGARRALLLHGPSGIGKSHLLHAAEEHAKTLHMPVASIRSFGGPVPMGPTDYAAEILRQVDGTDTLSGNRDFAWLAHEFDRNTSPCAVLIEDIDRLDPAVLEPLVKALKYSTRPLALLLSTKTAGEIPKELQSSGDFWFESLRLTGLRAEALMELASDLLGGPVVPSLGPLLAEASLGNPLLTIELLRCWRNDGILTRTGEHWGWSELGPPTEFPPTIASAVALRLDRLSADERSMLLLLALLGRAATWHEVRSSTQDPKALAALSGLTEGGFVTELDEPRLRYRVSQPVYTAAIVQTSSRTAVGLAHRAIFDGLSTMRSSSAELAHHASLSLEPPEGILDVIRHAARDADEARHFPQAAHWYRILSLDIPETSAEYGEALLAQGLAEQHFDPSGAVGTYGRLLATDQPAQVSAQALFGSAEAYRRLGNYAEARRSLREAQFLTTDPLLLFDIQHALAVHAGIQGRFQEARTALLALEAQTLSNGQRAKVAGHLAQVAYAGGDLVTACAEAERALALCQEENHRAFLGSNLAWYYLLIGMWTRADNLLTQGTASAADSGDVWTLLNMRADQARLFAWRGQIAVGIDVALEAIRHARSIGSAIDRLHCLDALATTLLEANEHAAAARVLEEALSLQREKAEPRDLALAYANYATARLLVGDSRTAERAIERASAHLDDAAIFEVLVDSVQADIHYRAGRPLDALSICEPWIYAPSPYVLGQATLLELAAQASDLAGMKPKALDLAGAAVAAYEELGAAARLERALAWISQRTARRGRPSSSFPHGLTKREVEVLWLTTQGKTAREVAEHLYISEGTVRKHLENIKTKAGISRKAELVTFAAGLGITPHSLPPHLAKDPPR